MLETDDLKQTIQWYKETLGFTIQSRFPEQDKLNWVSLQLNKVAIMFTSTFDTTHQVACGLTGSLYFYPEDVDLLWELIQAKDVMVEWPVEAFHYGMREFAILDNNGYKLMFGQSIDDDA